MTELVETDKTITTNPPVVIQVIKSSTKYKDEYYNSTKTMRIFLSSQVVDSLNNNPLLRDILRDFYDNEKIEQFTVIQAEAAKFFSRQIIEVGEKTGYHDIFNKAFSIAKTEFSCLVKVAKVVFKNDKMRRDTLRLFHKKQGKIGEIIEYMDIFYQALLKDEEAIAALSKYGYSRQAIIKSREKFTQASKAYSIFLKEKSEAVEATRIRNEKIAELDEWMYEYYALLKVAKIKRPDLVRSN